MIFSFKYQDKIEEKERLSTEVDDREKMSKSFDFLIDHLAKSLSFEKDELKLDGWIDAYLELIRNHYDSAMTIMPYSIPKTINLSEILQSFSRVARLCGRFRKKIVTNPRTISLNYVLIYYLTRYHLYGSDESPIVDLCISVLMELSCDRTYCINLNEEL